MYFMNPESHEALLPPLAPIDRLIATLNGQFKFARSAASLDGEARLGDVDEQNNPAFPADEKIDGDFQFISYGLGNDYIEFSHERIMLRAPDHVEVSANGFKRHTERSQESNRGWDNTTFHIVRPLLVSEADRHPRLFDVEGDDEDTLGVEYVRPNRFVIYLQSDRGKDKCYIAHTPPFSDDPVLEPFNTELFGDMDKVIEGALEELFTEIAADEFEFELESPTGEAPERSLLSQEDKELLELEMEALTVGLVYFLRNYVAIHPFGRGV